MTVCMPMMGRGIDICGCQVTFAIKNFEVSIGNSTVNHMLSILSLYCKSHVDQSLSSHKAFSIYALECQNVGHSNVKIVELNK